MRPKKKEFAQTKQIRQTAYGLICILKDLFRKPDFAQGSCFKASHRQTDRRACLKCIKQMRLKSKKCFQN
jgi:hypothetical protein